MNIDRTAYRNLAGRLEAEASRLAPDDPRRASLEHDAAQLRADADRGYSVGLTNMKGDAP